ncbi:MAG: sensor histidine kinase, partial [Bacteroidales bacterium]|nr:sensor histidine kinase [Bacteroidales bacterium]
FIRGKLQQVILEAIEEVSRISHNISPHVLEQYGLITALNNYIAPLARNNRIQVNFRSDVPGRVDLSKELTIYRCVTELLTNTLKHANATEITLILTRMETVLRVQYADNGEGYLSGIQKEGGMGLSNIRHRVESYNGFIDIDTAPGKGMKAIIEIPL